MNESADAAVQRLRDARGSAAELKTRLVMLRGDLPNGLIFVFEGDDDRGVYLSWMRQIDASIRYEPFSCGGKGGVLRLWDVAKRDLNGLIKDVYFFVDRDFDDLRGATADGSIFMTESYSIENYLVNGGVLDHVLKTEFHCHSSPLVRSRIVGLFERVYDQFLEVVVEYNRDLHVARNIGRQLTKALPKTVSKLAVIDLESVAGPVDPVNEVIVCEPPVSASEREGLRHAFDSLERRPRYRGKFALAFFRAWLERLATERRREGSEMFDGLASDVRIPTDRLNAATLAARADPPPELSVFLERISTADEPVVAA